MFLSLAPGCLWVLCRDLRPQDSVRGRPSNSPAGPLPARAVQTRSAHPAGHSRETRTVGVSTQWHLPVNKINRTLLLLLLSRFSRARLCAAPQTAAHQAPPSVGFSRQEHWRGCRFLLQCMKVKSDREVAQSCPTLRPHRRRPTRLLCPWDSPGRNPGVGAISFSKIQH